MSTTTATPALSLAERIMQAHMLVLYTAKDVVVRAIACGELLNEQKRKEGHGKWLSWLKASCPDLPERTAQRYMKLADNKEKIGYWLAAKSAMLADLTLTEAERIADEPHQSSAQGRTPTAVQGQTSSKSGNRGEGNKGPAAEYDDIEERLIKKLRNLPLSEVDDHSQRTIKAIKETVATMRAAAASAIAKAA